MRYFSSQLAWRPIFKYWCCFHCLIFCFYFKFRIIIKSQNNYLKHTEAKLNKNMSTVGMTSWQKLFAWTDSKISYFGNNNFMLPQFTPSSNSRKNRSGHFSDSKKIKTMFLWNQENVSSYIISDVYRILRKLHLKIKLVLPYICAFNYVFIINLIARKQV